jgi:hypothetical protein
MKLIVEEIDDVEFIVEEKNGKKSHYIQGPFLAGDVVNRNKRCYESRILDPAVQRYMADYLHKGRALGELSHPSGPQINLDRVSHKIVEMRKEGSNWMGKAKILETPMGRIASSLLSDGVTLGVSSRGMGSLVERNGINYVGEDYLIASLGDIVADPSGPDCFVTGLYENKEWVWDNGLLREVDVRRMQQRIEDSVPSGRLNEQILEEFRNFLLS